MQKSFLCKVGLLVVSVILGTIIGNVLLMGLLWTQGLSLSADISLSELISTADQKWIVLSGIGLNHLSAFTGSAVIYWLFVREGAFAKYFQLFPSIDHSLLGLSILLLICSYPLVGAAGLLTEYIAIPVWMQSLSDDYSSVMQGLFAGKGLWRLLLNILVLAALPAVGEELIFRGIVQKELHGLDINPHVVIVLTSVIFSAIHLQVEGFLPKFLISLVLCYVYYWGKSLWYPVILHFFNNAFMTIALYMGTEEFQNSTSEPTPAFPWLGVIFSLFLCALVIRSILGRLNLQNSNASTSL